MNCLKKQSSPSLGVFLIDLVMAVGDILEGLVM